MRSEVFLAEIRAERDKGGGRVLLDDNTDGGADDQISVCWSLDSKWTSLYIHMSLVVYVYIYIFGSDLRNIRLEPDLTQRNYCVSRGGPV